MSPCFEEGNFVPLQDFEEGQVVILAAAVKGNPGCRAQLPQLQSGFEEPYRTVASVVVEKLIGNQYLDPNTLVLGLQSRTLQRRNQHGQMEELTPQEVVGLIFGTTVEPGQAEAYLPLLAEQLDRRRRDEFTTSVAALVQEFGDRPESLVSEVQRLTVEHRKAGNGIVDQHPAEMLQIIPYIGRLEKRQRGSEFLGLDTGFSHVNGICNGLDTGLITIAAPPGEGKTTLVWQICQQAARINKVPVVFVSMEQSADELRAKALALISKLQYRHLLRGRLRADDPETWGKVLAAAQQYVTFARYLTIVEGDDKTTVDRILELALAKKAYHGAGQCLVAIDYLQIIPISPADSRRVTSTKDKIDLLCSSLRRLARRLDSPVIAISSENRAGYKKHSMDVFKESGGIEYSADIAAVLTRNKDESSPDFRGQKLNIIKNRNGATGVVKFKFYAERAEFVETGRDALPDDSES